MNVRRLVGVAVATASTAVVLTIGAPAASGRTLVLNHVVASKGSAGSVGSTETVEWDISSATDVTVQSGR